MEYLIISEKKIKIMLTSSDMEDYSISSDSLDTDINTTRDTLKKIFETVKRKCGFDFFGGRIFVKAYPCLSGGLEIYVTKLDDTEVGLIGDGKRDDYIISGFEKKKDALAAAEYALKSGNGRTVNVYEDTYRNIYILFIKAANEEKNDGMGFLKVCLLEMGAFKNDFVSGEMCFSRERYKSVRMYKGAENYF